MKNSFNIQELLHLTSKRHGTKPRHPSSSKTFQRHQEYNLKHPGSVDLITIKQNITNYRLPSYIDVRANQHLTDYFWKHKRWYDVRCICFYINCGPSVTLVVPNSRNWSRLHHVGAWTNLAEGWSNLLWRWSKARVIWTNRSKGMFTTRCWVRWEKAITKQSVVRACWSVSLLPVRSQLRSSSKHQQTLGIFRANSSGGLNQFNPESKGSHQPWLHGSSVQAPTFVGQVVHQGRKCNRPKTWHYAWTKAFRRNQTLQKTLYSK